MALQLLTRSTFRKCQRNVRHLCCNNTERKAAAAALLKAYLCLGSEKLCCHTREGMRPSTPLTKDRYDTIVLSLEWLGMICDEEHLACPNSRLKMITLGEHFGACASTQGNFIQTLDSRLDWISLAWGHWFLWHSRVNVDWFLLFLYTLLTQKGANK